jgi:hypothetical protein
MVRPNDFVSKREWYDMIVRAHLIVLRKNGSWSSTGESLIQSKLLNLLEKMTT